MVVLKIMLGVALAVLFQALALCITSRLMVEVPIRYQRALLIVGIEYLAIAVVAGTCVLAGIENLAITISAGSLTYLFVGAACIRAWIRFAGGAPVDVGNGVLIQAIQIPIIIPVLIVGSFLYDFFAL